MNCKNCGTELSEGSKFCSNCGCRIEIECTEEKNVFKEQGADDTIKLGEKEPVDSEIINDNSNIKGEKSSNVDSESTKKKMSKKKKIIIGIIVFLFICAGIGSCGSDSNNDSSSSTTKTESEAENSSDKNQEDNNSENTDNNNTNEGSTTETSEKTETSVPSAPKEINKADYDTGITYENLARTPDDYKYKKVKFYGKIIQVIEGDSSTQYRIAINDNYDNVIFLEASKEIINNNRILDGDHVTFYGTSGGVITYDSTLGGKITVPAVIVEKFER